MGSPPSTANSTSIMASASASHATRLCVLACRQAPRLQSTLPHPRLQQLQRGSVPAARRAFTVTTSKWDDAKQPPKAEGEGSAQKVNETTEQKVQEAAEAVQSADASSDPATSTPFATAAPESGNIELFGEQVMDATAKEHGYATWDAFVEGESEKGPELPVRQREFEKEFMAIVEPKQDRRSFWFEKEDPEPDSEEFDEFNEDDMTVMAHAKLQEVQEMRHYQRLAIWELPLLSKLAKPFEPPTSKQPLRWRYTTYMGDNHPAEKKVVVQFAPDDLGLTKVQTDKVKKLCGVRYNPETEVVKMSCESYQNQAQNKRFLADQIDKIIAEAKNGKDTFEDIPLDTRHHKSTNNKARFPKEWLMTEQRQKTLEEERKKFFQIEAQREETHQVVDGKIAIENHLMGKLRQDQAREQSFAPVRAAAPLRRSLGPKDRANRT